MTDFATRLAEVRARYLDRLAAMRAELAAGPVRERLLTLAHNLAGSGATYGFPEISERALMLEQALEGGEPASDLTDELLAALDETLPSGRVP